MPANTNMTTTPGLSAGMITLYNKNLLRTFEPVLAHLQFGDEHPFPKNNGTKMSFRKLIHILLIYFLCFFSISKFCYKILFFFF